MPLQIRRSALMGRVLVFASIAMSCAISWAQEAPRQPPVQRDDPATSGAGPTSGAPGQLNYAAPKAGSVTTDTRGVTTAQPNRNGAKTNDPPLDRGNDGVGTTGQNK